MKSETKADFPESTFDWPLAYDAERLVGGFIDEFLLRNSFARRLAERMRDETGTEFLEWTDHLTLDSEHRGELTAAGFREEPAEAVPGVVVLAHPRAMMPRVLLGPGGSPGGFPSAVAIRVERIADFICRHDLDPAIEGAFGARLRRIRVSEKNGASFFAVERLGHRGFVPRNPHAGFAESVVETSELWRTRKRDFADDADGVAHAFSVQKAAIGRVGADAACELFFAEERAFWEFRNRAARVQKRRQDVLGLGWANHDHHTFRCSRRHFADVVEFLGRFGFRKRERYYAGAEAGWGAQIMEHPVAGIVVFADVDLMPGEVAVDFSTQRLPEAPRMGTVGLWCGLHGDSFLQAGMHHLEARFDFSRLLDQLAREGIKTMKPFSDFPFLKQAFTEGERWPVQRSRAETLAARGLITREQCEGFIRDGAIGSHLENLQRKGGYKGFNQKAVSVIIAATDPRKIQEAAQA